MNTMTKKLTAVVFSLCAAASPAFAGRGGGAGLIKDAVASGSVDAIRAEVERAEKLMCEECIDTMVALTEHSRYEVREVAAWWFAKRPGAKNIMISQFKDDLVLGGSVKVRNAADFMGRVRDFGSLSSLKTALGRGDIDTEAKVAIVRAVGFMAHPKGNEILGIAFADKDAAVRAEAVIAYRDILGQTNATPVIGLLSDGDARVRAEAATVVGAYGELSARVALEGLLLNDKDPFVRRNAAYALGKIGSWESTAALTRATLDESGIVRGVAKGALTYLK